jgi:hypothetical protein
VVVLSAAVVVLVAYCMVILELAYLPEVIQSRGKVGSNSSAINITSNGGGGGRHYGYGTSSTVIDGGSGGGGARGSDSNGANAVGSGGTGIAGQGHNGGGNGTSNLGGGGGGAGGVGGNATFSPDRGGDGGIGKYFGYSFGRSLGYDGWFADGGGGGVRYNRTIGSKYHGAGQGGNHNSDTIYRGSTNAVVNTGSGGGGGGYSGSNSGRIGGNGGSGIVIIKYKGPQKATGGDSIITRRGYTIHVFTSSGTFTVGGRVGGLSTSKIVGTLNNMGSSNYSSANKGYFTFDGSNEYINLNTNFSDYVGVSLPATWEAFVYLNTSNNNETIIGSAWATGGVLFRKTGSPHTPSNRIRFLYFTNGSNGTGFDSQSTFASGWHHFVATYNGSGISYGNFDFYHNGIIANITNPTFGNPTTIPNKTFNVGGISAENTGYWSGNIAYVKLYNKLLSADQILDNYNATKGRFGL